MGRWTRRAMLAVMLLAGAAQARAQMIEEEPDTAALPADTVRLGVRLADVSDRCRPPRAWVVDDSASAAAVLAFPQCRGAGFGDLAARTLVGVPFRGDCHARYGLDAWRSARLREYRVRVRVYSGVCRSMRGEFRWLALPKLPAGWRVRFTRSRAESGEDEPDPCPAVLPDREAVAGLACLLAGAAPARAQIEVEPDTAALPADTVRFQTRFAGVPDGCRLPGGWVVDDSASAAAVLAFPQCRGADFGDLSERTLVGVPFLGDCHARYGVDAWRSASTREYRLRVRVYDGGCRAGRGEFHWLAVPRLPAGWRVTITRMRIDRGGRPAEVCLPPPPGREGEVSLDCFMRGYDGAGGAVS